MNRIYELFVTEGKRESEIADILNAQGLVTDYGRTPHAIAAEEKQLTSATVTGRGKQIAERVTTELVKSDLPVVERALLHRVLTEIRLQRDELPRSDALSGSSEPNYFDPKIM